MGVWGAEAAPPEATGGRSLGARRAHQAEHSAGGAAPGSGRAGVEWEERGGLGRRAHVPPLLNTMFKRRRGTSRSHGARAARPPMDLSAAAALCLWLLSACRPRDGLEAAAVLRAAGAGPAQSPGGARTLAPAAGDTAIPALAEAAVPGVRAARRAAGMGFRNGSIVPHQFMLSLYRTLAGKGAPTSGPGHHGRADTITGFADQATPGRYSRKVLLGEARPGLRLSSGGCDPSQPRPPNPDPVALA